MPFELEQVTIELGGRPVLRDVSFALRPGERVVLLGVNGCGKTTLLRLLDALVFPSRGRVRYAGTELTPRAVEQGPFRRRFRGEVGLLFQNVDAMLFNPSVADEIAFGPRQLLRAAQEPGAGATPPPAIDPDARVARWAEAFGVTELLERAPFELSGGEKKRVALAAVFALEPRVLLLDEATAGLDPASAAKLVELLAARPDVTVVASTHSLTLAEELGTRALLLAPGKAGVLFDGPPAELLADEQRLIDSGLAHRHEHLHGGARHAHFHVHDQE